MLAVDCPPAPNFSNTSAFVCDVENHNIDYGPSYVGSASSSIVYGLALNDISQAGTFRVDMHSKEYVLLLKEASWARSFFQSAPELNDVKSLLPYYKKINSLIVNENFYLCETFLSCLKVRDLSDVLLVGLLRLTSAWKSELPSWGRLLVDAGAELSRRGHDSKSMLKGLT